MSLLYEEYDDENAADQYFDEVHQIMFQMATRGIKVYRMFATSVTQMPPEVQKGVAVAIYMFKNRVLLDAPVYGGVLGYGIFNEAMTRFGGYTLEELGGNVIGDIAGSGRQLMFSQRVPKVPEIEVCDNAIVSVPVEMSAFDSERICTEVTQTGEMLLFSEEQNITVPVGSPLDCFDMERREDDKEESFVMTKLCTFGVRSTLLFCGPSCDALLKNHGRVRHVGMMLEVKSIGRKERRHLQYSLSVLPRVSYFLLDPGKYVVTLTVKAVFDWVAPVFRYRDRIARTRSKNWLFFVKLLYRGVLEKLEELESLIGKGSEYVSYYRVLIRESVYPSCMPYAQQMEQMLAIVEGAPCDWKVHRHDRFCDWGQPVYDYVSGLFFGSEQGDVKVDFVALPDDVEGYNLYPEEDRFDSRVTLLEMEIRCRERQDLDEKELRLVSACYYFDLASGDYLPEDVQEPDVFKLNNVSKRERLKWSYELLQFREDDFQ